MTDIWQLQEAKNKLSEVVNKALTQGPQIISRHGVEAVVVLSYTEYQSILLKRKKLSVFFRESPLYAEDLDLQRDRSALRNTNEL